MKSSFTETTFILGSPLAVTVMHRSVKASRNSPKTKSDICCSDTHLILINL